MQGGNTLLLPLTQELMRLVGGQLHRRQKASKVNRRGAPWPDSGEWNLLHSLFKETQLAAAGTLATERPCGSLR